MININQLFEKNSLNKNNKETLFLIEVSGIKNKLKEVNRQPLNLCIAIDVSGSMAQSISSRPYGMAGLRSVSNFELEKGFNERGLSKMELAKKAAIKAVHNMNEQDTLSIVTFDGTTEVVVPAIKVTSNNKIGIIKAIEKLGPRGSTDLHKGWVDAATEVAKNMKDKSINRVLVISDGDTNCGVMSSEQIASDVLALYNKQITTTTFGVGAGFNEDLLQAMSNSGGGNFYYISDEKEFDQMFEEEFSGMSNICGSEVKLQLQLGDGFKVKEQMNNLLESDNQYLLPNIVSTSKLAVMFKLETEIPKEVKKIKVGVAIIDYKDEDGNKKQFITEINMNVVGQKAWDKLDYNQEVKVQETLMIIANNKIAATKALDLGDVTGAKQLLAGSANMLRSAGFNDSRLEAQGVAIGATLLSAETVSSQEFRKDLAYQSYKTRSGKSDN